ncbi:MAG: radical SAM protein [Hahellaceae bacterium]|nr:radical SAM protein [Hahellaceae bacterium]MCP5168206.1 radical SAM protein [Hahellaceae bacterium]
MQQSRPRSSQLHLWRDQEQAHLLVVNGSQLFDLTPALEQQILQAIETGTENELLARLGLDGTPMINDEPPEAMPIHAFSLAIAQKCNLGCTYCYAQQGEFGGPAKNMSLATALQAVDTLVEQTPVGGKFNLAFMGGEPLVNRSVLYAATEHAVQQAKVRGVTPSFSITTNGTLVTEQDADFFEQHGFAVTISLDGIGETHDKLRPTKGGKGSFERIMKNVRPLLSEQRNMQVTARVTVTPQNLGLRAMLDQFLAEGFHSVGFSPMLNAPNGQGEMGRDELQLMLAEMIDCGREFERQTRQGKRYAFANMLNAMREIGKGTHRPYPCGAGAGYMGVSAEGDLFACHRFVDDDAGAMGNLELGIDATQQNDWLKDRHVHQQNPCNQCWAKYLCGGGCHHEVIGKGRLACDYVRGWLEFCMGVYLRVGS